jgi:hypothetical protein
VAAGTSSDHVPAFEDRRQHFDEVIADAADRFPLPPPQSASQLLVNSPIRDSFGDFGVETLRSRVWAGIGECRDDFGVPDAGDYPSLAHLSGIAFRTPRSLWLHFFARVPAVLQPRANRLFSAQEGRISPFCHMGSQMALPFPAVECSSDSMTTTM